MDLTNIPEFHPRVVKVDLIAGKSSREPPVLKRGEQEARVPSSAGSPGMSITIESSAAGQDHRHVQAPVGRGTCGVETQTSKGAVINRTCAIAERASRSGNDEESACTYLDSRCSLIAKCRSTAAVPAHSLVCLGPNLILVRFNCTGFFSECFISSATDRSKYEKTPVALCLSHKRLLSP